MKKFFDKFNRKVNTTDIVMVLMFVAAIILGIDFGMAVQEYGSDEAIQIMKRIGFATLTTFAACWLIACTSVVLAFPVVLITCMVRDFKSSKKVDKDKL